MSVGNATPQRAPVTAYIGIGGNVGDVRLTFMRALNAISQFEGTTVTAVSSIYQSPPWGGVEQDDYLNAVIAIETVLTPSALLSAMRELEQDNGRDRAHETRWGPRTLDLDLLLYGDQTIETDELQVPHPRMLERDFVMVPLLEIAPEIAVPGHGAVTCDDAQWNTGGSGLQRVPDDAN